MIVGITVVYVLQVALRRCRGLICKPCPDLVVKLLQILLDRGSGPLTGIGCRHGGRRCLTGVTVEIRDKQRAQPSDTSVVYQRHERAAADVDQDEEYQDQRPLRQTS